MLNDIRMLLQDSAAISAIMANKVRAKLLVIMMVALVIVLMMWGINSVGYKEINIFFFFFGGIYILLQATKPLTLGVAAGAGSVAAALLDKDISQGAIIGLKTLYQIAIGALFGFWFLGGLLATWSFAEQPIAFFYVMMGILVITVTTQLYGIKSNKLEAKLVIAYAVVIIFVSFWQTIDKKDLPKVAIPSLEAISTSKTPQEVYIQVDLRNTPVGASVPPVQMGLNSIVILRMTPVIRRHGNEDRQYACPEAKELSNLLPVMFETVAGAGTTAIHVAMTKDTKRKLLAAHIDLVDVTFTIENGPMSGKTICKFEQT